MAINKTVYRNKVRLRWRHHIRQWLCSDELIIDYCREHKLGLRCFHKYKNLLGQEILAEMAAQQGQGVSDLKFSGVGQSQLAKKVRSKDHGSSPFVELKVQPERESSACICIELPDGVKIKFPPETAPDDIARILHACAGGRQC